MLRAARAFGRGLRRGEPIPPLDEAVLPLRVQPLDIDLNLHMTNSRYFDLMNVARLDYVSQTGVLREMLRRRWRPILGSIAVRFRLPLGPLQRFTLRTRLLCWDEKWLYMSQRFVRGEDDATLALAKILIASPRGPVAAAEFIAIRSDGLASPPMPEVVRDWLETERHLKVGSGAEVAGA